MVYEPPTLSELYARVGRDLRDPEHLTLDLDVLGDFINDGIAEINQVKPPELRLEVTDLEGLASLPFSHVWKVEAVRTSGEGQNLIPPNNDGVAWQNGWTYFAHRLELPQATVRWLAQVFEDITVVIRIYGYYDRDPLADVEDTFDGDLEDEQLLRRYCKALGFEALKADRNLYQQWQAQANNADVSPTQLTAMADAAMADWHRIKRRAYAIRMPAAGF